MIIFVALCYTCLTKYKNSSSYLNLFVRYGYSKIRKRRAICKVLHCKWMDGRMDRLVTKQNHRTPSQHRLLSNYYPPCMSTVCDCQLYSKFGSHQLLSFLQYQIYQLNFNLFIFYFIFCFGVVIIYSTFLNIVTMIIRAFSIKLYYQFIKKFVT